MLLCAAAVDETSFHQMEDDEPRLGFLKSSSEDDVCKNWSLYSSAALME